jgi:hypothetical protein
MMTDWRGKGDATNTQIVLNKRMILLSMYVAHCFFTENHIFDNDHCTGSVITDCTGAECSTLF